MIRSIFPLLICWLSSALLLPGQVVINEIFYDAPGKVKDLQWVELHNVGDQAVNLAGWKLSKAIKYTFPANATLAPQSYVVVCKSKPVFTQYYKEIVVAGEFEKSLKQAGERIDLRDATGNLVDSVTYTNSTPFHTGANGQSSSLERVCPTVSGSLAHNWATSAPAEDRTKPGGTPGAQNSVYAAHSPSQFEAVKFAPLVAQPEQPIQVEAKIQDAAGVREAAVCYHLLGKGGVPEEKTVTMTAGAGAVYTATIPAQIEGTVIRFYLRAVNGQGETTCYPPENEPRPWFACVSQKLPETVGLPLAYLIHTAGDIERFEKRGTLISNEERTRQMIVRRQRPGTINLPLAWATLALKDAPAEELFKLAPVFAAKYAEYGHLEQEIMACTIPASQFGEFATRAQEYNKSVGAVVLPVLVQTSLNTPENQALVQQSSGFDWRNTSVPGMNELNALYLEASTLPGLTVVQFSALRDAYREVTKPLQARLGRNSALVRVQFPGAREKLVKPLRAILLAKNSAPGVRRLATQILAPPDGTPAAFLYVDPKTRQPQLFDDVRVFARHGGYKIHLNKGESLEGMPTINLAFKEEAPRWALTEPLSYEMHRRAGQNVCRIDYARMTIDGTLQGYCLCYEQVNKSFLHRLGINQEGNLYKGTCHGHTVEGQNIFQSGEPGHADILALVEQLNQTQRDPAAQWEIIRREFDAEKLVSHYATRLLLSDWDGFFNNYSLYHDTHGTKKWTFYVWDQDKTWGDYDGYPDLPLLTTMPLTYAALGDCPEGWTQPEPPDGFVPGQGSWWRPGSHLSKPILANPTFRQHLLARMKDLLEKEFSPERLNPVIDQLPVRLEAEVRLRAEAYHQNPGQAVAQFQKHLASLKAFLSQRRAWLLAQKEIQSAAAYDPAKLK